MRDNSVSIAKGVAIILMVLAHSRFSEYGNYWINMFHMPLFFFMAGYCFKDKYLDASKDYITRRIKGIYFPYVKWSLIFLLPHNLFYHLNIYNDVFGFRGKVSHLYSLSEYAIRGVHIVTKMTGHEHLLGGFWFLKTFLFASIIGFIILKYVRKPILGGAILLFLTIILVYADISVPYFEIGARETFASSFFVTGYAYKKSNSNLSAYLIPLVLFSIFLITVGMEFWQATLQNFTVIKVLPYYMTATIATIAVLEVCKQLNNKKINIIVNIGNNTLTILTWHFLCFRIVNLLIIYIYRLPVERLAEYPAIEEYSRQGWFVAYTAVGVLIPLLMSKVKFLR